MKRRGLTPEGQTLEGLMSGAEKSQEEFQKVEAGKVVVSICALLSWFVLVCSGMPSAASEYVVPSETTGGLEFTPASCGWTFYPKIKVYS